MTAMNDISTAMPSLIDELLTRLREARSLAEREAQLNDASRFDSLFGKLFAELLEVAQNNPKAHNMALWAQLILNIESELRRSEWNEPHKGAFYYNLGLFWLSVGNVHAATSAFLNADAEDHRLGVPAGSLFLNGRHAELVKRFFEPTLKRIGSSLQRQTDAAVDFRRLMTQIGKSENPYLRSKGVQAIFLLYKIAGARADGTHLGLHEYLEVLDDLVLLSEASTRLLHGRKDTLGKMMQPGEAAAMLGYEYDSAVNFDPGADATSRDSKATLSNARKGIKKAAAEVVRVTRNQTAHAGDVAPWILDHDVLWDVLLVHFEFILDVLNASDDAGKL